MLKEIILLTLFSTAFSLYNVSYITTLTTENFDTVLDSGDIWIVEFYAEWCSHCKKFADDFKKTARALRGYVKFGAIHGDKHQKITNKYRVQEYPSVHLFGFNKDKPIKYDETMRNPKGMIEMAVKAIQDKAESWLRDRLVASRLVVQLYDDNFEEALRCSRDSWMVYFYEEDSKSVRKALVTASKNLKGMVMVGAYNLKNNTIHEKYSLTPGLKFFPMGVKKGLVPEAYESELTGDKISDWGEEKYNEFRDNEAVLQLTDEDVLRDACEYKPICNLLILPKLSKCDAECRYGYLELVGEFAKKYNEENWGWVWSEARAQPGIENVLEEIEKHGYPCLVSVSVEKKEYYVVEGEVTSESLAKYFENLAGDEVVVHKIEETKYPNIEFVRFWCDSQEVIEVEDDKIDETESDGESEELGDNVFKDEL